MSWIYEKSGGVAFLCLLQPRASRSEIVGLHGEPPRLRIRVAAPPVDGEANKELVRFLAKKLGIAKNKIQILSGQSGKFKELWVSQGNLAALTQLLLG